MLTARTIIVIAIGILLIGLIGVFYYYSFYRSLTEIKEQENEKDLASEEESTESKELEKSSQEEDSSEDYTDSDDESFRERESNQWQEPEPEFEEEGYSEDYTDSYDGSFRENVFREMENKFRDLVFDRVLARIVGQVDGRKFQARFCESNLMVPCYLRPELYSNLTRPLMGGMVRLEYNYVSRVFNIIELVDSQTKEGPSSWVWNTVFAEIIGEDEEMGERILYASLEPGQNVLCKVSDHLRDAFIRDGDIVYLEVNETDRSFYKILEIVDPCDS